MSTPLAALLTSPMPGSSVGGDLDASRTVYGAVIVLVVIGLALVFLAGWLFRSTRVDLRLLSPLETMSDRKWRKLDPASQRRLLDEERPEGARPLHLAASRPDVDDDFESGVHAAEGFDDLSDADSGDEADSTSPVTLSAASNEVAEDDASDGSGAERSPDLDDAKVDEDGAGPEDVATDDEDASENHAADDAEVTNDGARPEDAAATDDEEAREDHAAEDAKVDEDGAGPEDVANGAEDASENHAADDAKVDEGGAGPEDMANGAGDASENHVADDAEVDEGGAGPEEVATEDEDAAAAGGAVADVDRAPGGVPAGSAGDEEPESREAEQSSADESPDDIGKGARPHDNQHIQSESATFGAAASERHDDDESDAGVRAADSGASASRRA